MEEMEREQKEFKEITENMSEGFLLLDKNLEILSFNKAAIELLGYGDGEAPSNAFELNRSKSFRTAVDEALDGTMPRSFWRRKASVTVSWPVRCLKRKMWWAVL